MSKFNNAPCPTCRHFHAVEDCAGHALLGNILEANTIKRGGERFFACPDCEKLFAVKKAENGVEGRYDVVTAAFVARRYHWIVDMADGSRQQTKAPMTEDEARRRYNNIEKVVHRRMF